MEAYYIHGQVIDATTQTGFAGVRVEAWDKLLNQLVGSSTTDANGSFDISFAENYQNRLSDLFFKVLNNDRLLLNTEREALWNMQQHDTPVILSIGAQSARSASSTAGNAAALPFKVSGKVTGNTVVNKITVIAYDVDVRGAAIFDTAQTLAEIEKSGGFELLGRAITNADGFYEIAFGPDMFAKNEKDKADVIVYALKEAQIIGHSKLARSVDYTGSLLNNWDVPLTAAAGVFTEYAILQREITPLQQGLNFTTLAASSKYIKFLADESQLAFNQVNLYLITGGMAETFTQFATDTGHELLYGLARSMNNTAPAFGWSNIAAAEVPALVTAINKAIANTIIKVYDAKLIQEFASQAHNFAVNRVLQDKPDGSQPSPAQILNVVMPDKPVLQTTFLSAYANHTGSPEEFWTKVLPAQPGFDSPELVKQLQFTNQLSYLTANHLPMIQELHTRGFSSAQDMTRQLEAADWIDIVKKTGAPDSITGTADEKVQRYASALHSAVDAAYPTQAVERMVKNQTIPIAQDTYNGVLTFFDKAANFDLANTPINIYIQNNPQVIAQIGEKDRDKTIAQLKKLQRAVQVSPASGAMSILMKNDLTSSYRITRMSKESFLYAYADKFDSTQTAEMVYERANYIQSRNEQVYRTINEAVKQHNPYVTGNGNGAVEQAVLKVLPNYTALFGPQDTCECQECHSVYSAAAYLVDILQFLHNNDLDPTKTKSNPTDLSNTALEILLKRRPDLQYLELTCENTNTVLPYIDLVNEIMEYYVYHSNLTNYKGFNIGEDDTSEELDASAQHTEIEAYRILAAKVSPFTLPYNQPLDVIRTYLDGMNSSRYEVMETGFTVAPAAADWVALTSEYLSLSLEEYQVLTGKQYDGSNSTLIANLCEAYGYTTDHPDAANPAKDWKEYIAEVPQFLQQTGITYNDLVSLMQANYLNPNYVYFQLIDSLFIDYKKLNDIATSGSLASSYPDTKDYSVLQAYLAAQSIPPANYKSWATDLVQKINKIIVLYAPDSTCDLSVTKMQHADGAGLTGATATGDLGKLHRFIRLWKKLGWSINDLDYAISSLGADITPDCIAALANVARISKSLGQPPAVIIGFWTAMQTTGKGNLYAKLFLNKALQKIDDKFTLNIAGTELADTTQLISDHIKGLMSALKVSETDVAAIRKDAALDAGATTMNLQRITAIYRYTVLAKALGVKIPELIAVKSVVGVNPFDVIPAGPAKTLEFIEKARKIIASGFKGYTLNYIINNTPQAGYITGPNTGTIIQSAITLREGLVKIESDNFSVPEFTADVLTTKLSLVYDTAVVNKTIAIIENSGTYTANCDKALTPNIPAPYQTRVTYNKLTGVITSKGVLTQNDSTALLTPANDPTFKAALSNIFTQPRQFLTDSFNGFLDVNEAHNPNAIKQLIDEPSKDADGNIMLTDQYNYFITALLPFLRKKLGNLFITQTLAEGFKLTPEITTVLTTAVLKNGSLSLIDDCSRLKQAGLTGYYFNGALPADNSTALVVRNEETLNFNWKNGSPDALINADHFSARWEGFITADTADDYILWLTVDGADETVKLFIQGQPVTLHTTDNLQYFSDPVSLKPKVLQPIKVEYTEATGNAALSLYWQSASVPRDVVPAGVLYPQSIIDDFTKDYLRLFTTGLLVTGLKIDQDELTYFTQNAADYDNLDFNAFTFAHWLRLYDYVTLRKSIGDKTKGIIALMALVKNTPALTADDFAAALNLITRWDTGLIKSFTTEYLPVTAFNTEKAYIRIQKRMLLCTKLGIDMITLKAWAKTNPQDFDTLNSIAQNVKYTFKARYEEEQWLKAVKPLNDTLRTNQKNALIGYLLVQPQLVSAGVTDADGLFEYFLIDVQMCSCMETSRLVQATASVQLFIQRCFLNLEKEVNPAVLSASRWEWMQDYRLWEANRKVFLYPENWLDPAWRDDKSPFFKELESELLQGDITNENVEDALKGYLFKLDEVARLDVCGMYQEKDSSGKPSMLHVFGRTHNAPYIYYYRTFDNVYGNWSAWEKVQVDITGTDEGNTHGVHLLPVVINKRLYIFWLLFTRKQDTSRNNDSTMQQSGDKTQTELSPDFYWEINIGWSEYKDGKWTAKKISGKPIIPGLTVTVQGQPGSTFARYPFVDNPKLFSLYYAEASRKLVVKKEVHGGAFQDAGYFTFSIDYKDLLPSYQVFEVDANAFLQIVEYLLLYGLKLNFNYLDATENRQTDFMGNDRTGDFEQNKAVILKTPIGPFDLLYTHQDPNVSFFSLNDDFFYRDAERTFFVTPVQAYYLIPILLEPSKTPVHPGISKKFKPVFVVEEPNPLVPIGPDPVEYSPVFKNNSVLAVSAKGTLTPVESYGRNAINVVNGVNDVNGAGAPVMETHSLAADNGNGHAMTATNGAAVTNTTVFSREYQLMANKSVIAAAFQQQVSVVNRWVLLPYTATVFYPFFHPHTHEFIKQIYAADLDGFYAIATQRLGGASEATTSADTATKFYNTYQPEPLNVKTPYPRENVDFSVEGKSAYSQYNWELFFHVPVMIATKLSANQQFADAMKWFHYIFNPTTNDPDTTVARYWNLLKFKDISAQPAQSLEDFFETLQPNKQDATIAEWRDNPFKPHLVARNMPVHYMKYVVMKYIDNLVAWGDQLFRQDTIESVNKATQLYVMAAHILGPRPEIIPQRGKIQPETYNSLLPKWDAFSNALVEFENAFPYSSEVVSSSSVTPSGSILGMGHALYFSIPQNDQLMGYWDTVEDRLYKIRHCLNIEGIFSIPALFAPEIDPGALIGALAAGGSVSSVLSDLNSPLPYYRFSYIIEKAFGMCNDLKALGSAMLSALEKKDAEALARLRASHETSVLSMTLLVKENQIEEAKQSFDGLQKSRNTAAEKFLHYCGLLGVQGPNIPGWDADTDTQIADVNVGVDDSLVSSDEAGVKIIPREKEEFDRNRDAQNWKDLAANMEITASLMHLIPDFVARATPVGVGGGFNYGGSNIGAAVSTAARVFDLMSSDSSYAAIRASKFATLIRREEEWVLQANLAAREIMQIDKQINAANVRIKIATQERDNIKKQIEQSQEVEQFLQSKYTNQELYEWMKSTLAGVYFQSYQLAYDLAKKAEKTYRFERNDAAASFIRFGYWDNLHSGLLSGESLYLALKQMERSYMDNNKRDYEITKHVSLCLHDPLALIALKENGSCEIALPEELFDMDYPGHYMRRIKSVSLTIPCVTGPYTSINCTLTLLGNTIRISGSKDPQYLQNTDADDDRFVTSFMATQSVAASQALNDSGLFELNFRDERYLPFEGAGAISKWRIELPAKFRQFDYGSISDVIIQIKYTARDGGRLLQAAAVDNLTGYLKRAEELSKGEGLYQLFSLKHEFPNEWYQFFNPANGDGQQLKLQNLKSRMPYFTKTPAVTGIDVEAIELFVKGNDVSVKLNGDTLGNAEAVGTLKHYATGNTVPTFNDDWTFTPAAGAITKDDLQDAWVVVRYIVNS